MVASISQDKWDLLGLPLGTPQADTVINKSLEQLNDRRGKAAELNIGRNQIQRLDTVSESLKRMQREQVAGFTKVVADAVADANILSIGELMNIRDSVKDLTKTLKANIAFQPGNRRSAAQRALEGFDYDGPDRRQRRNNKTTMQRTNRGNVQVRPPSVPKTQSSRPFPNLKSTGNYSGGSVPNFPQSNSPQTPNGAGGGGLMDAVKYIGSAILTRLPAIAAVGGVATGVSIIGDENRKNLEGVAPGKVHNFQKNKMKAANQAAHDRILATREAVELNKPENLDAVGNPTAQALETITEKSREYAKEQLEELDGDIADLKRKSEKGFLSKLGGWLGLISSESSQGGAAAGAAVAAGMRPGDITTGGRFVGRYSGYNSEGSSVAKGAVVGSDSSVGDVGGMARAGSRVTGNIVNPNVNYQGGFVDPSTNPNVNKDVLAKYEGKNLPVVIRNNNPAALSITGQLGNNSFAERQEGYVGATPRPANEGGWYAKYATPEHGVAANARLLESYGAKGINTADAIVRKWSTDAGAHAAYSKTLQKALGVEGDTPLDLNDKEIQRKILMAKSGHESGAGVPIYNEETFRRGVNREFPQVAGAQNGTILQPDGKVVPAGSSNVIMANQGKIRDMDIKPELKTQLEYAAAQNGVKVEVTSGGQPEKGTSTRRTGSVRHDGGGAADLQLYRTDENGKRTYLDMNNPADAEIMKKFTSDSVKAGATGVGAGYMGGKTLHIGGGTDASWGGAPWVEEARKAGVVARAGFDVNKWAAERSAEAAGASAVTPSQKTYSEKMADAGFTQKTPFGIRTPGGTPAAGNTPVAGNAPESAPATDAAGAKIDRMVDYYGGPRNPYAKEGYGDLAPKSEDIKRQMGSEAGTQGAKTNNIPITDAHGKIMANSGMLSSEPTSAGDLQAPTLSKMAMRGDLNTGGMANSFGASGGLSSSGFTSVTPGTVETPAAYTAPEPASAPAASDGGGGGGGGGSTPQVSPSEIKTQPDDIGLNGMNTTDNF